MLITINFNKKELENLEFIRQQMETESGNKFTFQDVIIAAINVIKQKFILERENRDAK
jgi:hypothetical protein